MSALKIALLHHFDLDFFSGGEKFILQTANELANRGHEVSVFTTPFVIENRKAHKDAHKLLSNKIQFSKAWKHQPKADIAYVMYDPYSPINRAIFDLSNCRAKITGVHSSSFWEPTHLMYGKIPNVGRLAQVLFGNFELSRYDAVHTLTNALPIRHSTVYVIPNYVDSDLYQPKDKKSAFTVAFTSRHSYAKGFDTFQKVIENLGVDVAVSSGDMSEQKLIDLIATSHISFLPSRVDTFGYSIVESAMCGTPIITTPLLVHKKLDLPLMYGYDISNFEKRIKGLSLLYTKDKQMYYTWCYLNRVAARCRYDKAVILDRFEKMLKEVFQRKVNAY
jgi:glycosyltransferase involved in cell wall biosynthesis